MNIFDIIDKKRVDAVLKQNAAFENNKQSQQADEQNIENTQLKLKQEKTYTEKFADLLKAERSRFDYQKAKVKPFEHVTMKELQRLHIMAKFAKLNPYMTNQQFQEVLDNKMFEAYKILAEEYTDGDFLEEIRDHGSLYIATRINSNREFSKLYDDIEEIDFNKDQNAW